MAVAMGVLSVVPATAMGATGDVNRQGLLPSGGVATTSVEGAVFSPTGRYVLVTSTSNLVGGALFAHRQLFMRDRTTGRATLVSSSATGTAANAAVDDPSDGRARPYGVSIDGRYVVFASAATNLVATDSNGSDVDVFRKDTQTGRITIVSRDSRGAQPPDGVVGQPSLSADGMRVAFTSGTEPLVTADANGVADIYLADMRAASLTLVSRTSGGVQSTAAVDCPSLSADGRAVAFHGTAAAAVLAAGDTDAQDDIYVARPRARTITVASLPTGGTDNGPSTAPSISGDGSLVAFTSTGPLVGGAGDSGASPDVFVRDVDAAVTRRVSAAATTGGPAISINGARVAFAGATDGTDAGDVAANGDDVYVRTLATGALYRASRDNAGSAPVGPSTRPAISGTGGLAAFTTNDGGTSRADVWATDVGAIAPTTPALTARATQDGRRVTVAGHASDEAGVMSVTVGGRMARMADDGAYSVSYTAPVGTESVTVTATSGVGATETEQVSVTRSRSGRGAAPAAARPTGLRVRVARPWAIATFRLPTAGTWRVELRRRVQGPARAAAFRAVAWRSGGLASGKRVVRLRIPAKAAAGRYQVRVLMLSAQGLGTTARTIAVP